MNVSSEGCIAVAWVQLDPAADIWQWACGPRWFGQGPGQQVALVMHWYTEF